MNLEKSSKNLSSYSIKVNPGTTYFDLVARFEVESDVEKGYVICVDAKDKHGTSLTFTSGHCSYSQDLESWFFYVPAPVSRGFLKFRRLQMDGLAEQLEISLRAWKEKEVSLNLAMSKIFNVIPSNVDGSSLILMPAEGRV